MKCFFGERGKPEYIMGNKRLGKSLISKLWKILFRNFL